MHLQEGRLVLAYILFLSMALSTKNIYKIICIFWKPKSSIATVGTHNSAHLNSSMIFLLLVVKLLAVLIFNVVCFYHLNFFILCCNITMRENTVSLELGMICIKSHNHWKHLPVGPSEKHSS